MVGQINEFKFEIERRINSCKPTLFSTDYFSVVDKNLFENNSEQPFLFRNFNISIENGNPAVFAGDYKYKNKIFNVSINVFYNISGANRVLGTSEIDFKAFCMQDAEDILNVLDTPIILEDGSNGRLLFANNIIDMDDENVVLSLNFEMHTFLVSESFIHEKSVYVSPTAAQLLLSISNSITYMIISDANISNCSVSCAGVTFSEDSFFIEKGKPKYITATVSETGNYTINFVIGGVTYTREIYAFEHGINTTSYLFQPNPAHQYETTIKIVYYNVNDGTYNVEYGDLLITGPSSIIVENNFAEFNVEINDFDPHTITIGDKSIIVSRKPKAYKRIGCGAKSKIYEYQYMNQGTYFESNIHYVKAPYWTNFLTFGIKKNTNNVSVFNFLITLTTYGYFAPLAGGTQSNFFGTSINGTAYPNIAIMFGAANSRGFTFYYRNYNGSTTRNLSFHPYYAIPENGNLFRIAGQMQYDFNNSIFKLKGFYQGGIQVANATVSDPDGLYRPGYWPTGIENMSAFVGGPWVSEMKITDVVFDNENIFSDNELARYTIDGTIPEGKGLFRHDYIYNIMENGPEGGPYYVAYDSIGGVPIYCRFTHPAGPIYDP